MVKNKSLQDILNETGKPDYDPLDYIEKRERNLSSFASFLRDMHLTEDDQGENEFTVEELKATSGLKKGALYARLNILLNRVIDEREDEEGHPIKIYAISKRKGNTGKVLYRFNISVEKLREL